MRKELEATKTYIGQRVRIQGINSQAKKHVHVAGGDSKEALEGVRGYFEELGFDACLQSSRAHCYSRPPRAGVKESADADAPLDELDFRADEKDARSGLWSSERGPEQPRPRPRLRAGDGAKVEHALAAAAGGHGGEKVQRRVRPEAEIDVYFGWNERMLKKAMQAHYASLSIRERMALARITGKM